MRQRTTRIRFLREQRSLSQGELARMIDASQQTISAIENRDVKNPHPKTLRKLAEALQIPVADLFTTNPDEADKLEKSTETINAA